MKKIISFLLTLTFIVPVFSQKLYLDIKSIFEESTNKDLNFDSIFEEVLKTARENDIEIIDYNSLDLVHYTWNYGVYQKAKTESEKLTERKNKLEEESDSELYINSFKKTVDGQKMNYYEYLAYLDNQITAAKEKEAKQIDPGICYPRLEMSLYPRTSYNREYYYFNADFYYSKETIDGVSGNFTPDYLQTTEEKEKLILRTITAFFSAVNSKERTLAQPSIIDSREMTELGTTRNGLAVTAIPRKDYSFVMRIKDSLYNVSPTWDFNENLTKKISGETKYNSYWQLYSPDGKNIYFANEKTPVVLCMNEQNSITQRLLYKYPGVGTMLNFYNSGEPYLIDSENRRIILPQQGDKETEYMKYPIELPHIIAGSDDTFYFQEDSLIFVYSAKTKELKNVIFPQRKDTGFFSIQTVLNDGSFLAITEKNHSLNRFSKHGTLMWSIPIDESLIYSFCCGAGWGMYYFYDVRSNSIWRVAEADTKLPPALIAMKNINKKTENATFSELAASYKANADVLYNSQSYVTALEYYNKYLEISPADPVASERKILSEVAINKKEAMAKTEEALNLFDEYGEETAREKYQEAMKLLEKLKKQVPWDEEVLELYTDLKNAFSPADGFTKADIPSVEITSFDFSVLFPVLMNVYASNPAGLVTIKNTGDSAIKNVSVTSYVRKYMDFPSKGNTVASIAPGEEGTLDISTVLNKSVLKVSENTVLQMQFTINWEEDGKANSFALTRPVTLYKKSAMTWDDTAMLACFVQPNDPTVAAFAFNALAKKQGDFVSTNVSKAIALSNAIGAIPLTYVADPVTPISQVIDLNYSVDTVRFPAETLSLKGGDCDDMTTLYCSLLESAGIQTALITTPGHIFAAFDTGLKANTLWSKLDENYCIIEINNHIWIPIETTILYNGFDSAWESAAKEISSGKYEYTLLHDAWEIYVTAANPDEVQTVSFTNDKLDDLNKASIAEISKMLTLAIDKASTNNPVEMNAAAKLLYSMGQKEKAADLLLALTKNAPDYKQAYANLAAIYQELGMEKEAKQIADKGKRIKAKDTTLVKTEDTLTRAADSSGFEWQE